MITQSISQMKLWPDFSLYLTQELWATALYTALTIHLHSKPSAKLLDLFYPVIHHLSFAFKARKSRLNLCISDVFLAFFRLERWFSLFLGLDHHQCLNFTVHSSPACKNIINPEANRHRFTDLFNKLYQQINSHIFKVLFFFLTNM